MDISEYATNLSALFNTMGTLVDLAHYVREFADNQYAAGQRHKQWVRDRIERTSDLRRQHQHQRNMNTTPVYRTGQQWGRKHRIASDRADIGRTVASVVSNNRKHKQSKDDLLVEFLTLRNACSSNNSISIMAWVSACDALLGDGTAKAVNDRLYSTNTGAWGAPPKEFLMACITNDPLHDLHHPHVSETDPSMLAYTQSLDKLKRGITTKIKPGRYLAKYCPNMSQEVIKYLAERWDTANDVTLEYVENDDPEGWVDVYRNGPASCMQGEDCVRVYALEGNGLRLAYWRDEDNDIIARAIVIHTEDRKEYVRVYPNEDDSDNSKIHQRFRAALEKEGYTHGSLVGIKLAKIERRYDPGYLCPYIDTGAAGSHARYVTINHDHLLIGLGGDIYADSTCGYIGGHQCDECGDTTDEDDLHYVECDEISVCDYCLDRRYVRAYGRHGSDYYREDDCVEVDGEWYLLDTIGYHDIAQCAADGEYYSMDDLVMCDVGQYEGEMIHNEVAARDEITDETCHEGEVTQDENGITTFDEYLRTDYITGDEYHKDTVIEITIYRRNSLYVHPDNLTAEVLTGEFVNCGGKLFPRKYMGNAITEAFEPNNVTYPDDGNTSYDTVEDLLDEHFDTDDGIPFAHLPQPPAVITLDLAA